MDIPAIYRFDRFVLDLGRGMLLADRQERALRPKSFALLCHLVENAERLVSRDEIMRAVWPDVLVTEDSITQCIREIRRALGDEAQTILRTVTKRGYLLAAAPSRLNGSGLGSAAVRTASASAQALPPPPADRPLVTVLPFENIGGDPDQGYFADGLTADLVTDLTRFQDLHIISPPRHGVRPLSAGSAGLLETLPAAARYVLSGTVRRAGGRIRVTVQLEDAPSGVRLWAERFDRPLDELFAVQEDLTNQIAASVDLQVGREGLRRARRRSPASLDAYDLYLQGRELHSRTTEADTLLARQMLDRAIAADPDYAQAYAYQSYTVLRGFTLGWGEPRGRAALDPSLDLASRGVALDPGSSLCMLRLAFVLSLLGRNDEAVEIGAKGVRANPCDPASRTAFGETLSMYGAHEAAVSELQIALSLNPFHPPFWWATLGRALLLAGRPEEALAYLRRCAARSPDYRPCHSSMVVAFVETGRLDAARAAMREVLRLRQAGWTVSDYEGVFGFRNRADTDRFLDAFRAAMA